MRHTKRHVEKIIKRKRTMIDFGRVANNMIFLGILGGLGYLIYIRMKKQGTPEKFKSMFSRGKI